MKLHDVPPAEYAFAYRDPPVSGNIINGLGEETPRRASGCSTVSAAPTTNGAGLNVFFQMVSGWRFVRQGIKNRWRLRNSAGPVAKTRTRSTTPRR